MWRLNKYGGYGSNEKGFTLLEVVVVLVILGALVAVAVPLYNNQMKESRTAEAVSRLTAIMDASLEYYQQYGAWPAAPGVAGYHADFSNTKHFKYRINKGAGGTGKFHLRAKGRNVDGMKQVKVFMKIQSPTSKPFIQIQGI
jgi:prepilin-type N-terminal cleavage/methylation domain-containing protein